MRGTISLHRSGVTTFVPVETSGPIVAPGRRVRLVSIVMMYWAGASNSFGPDIEESLGAIGHSSIDEHHDILRNRSDQMLFYFDGAAQGRLLDAAIGNIPLDMVEKRDVVINVTKSGATTDAQSRLTSLWDCRLVLLSAYTIFTVTLIQLCATGTERPVRIPNLSSPI